MCRSPQRREGAKNVTATRFDPHSESLIVQRHATRNFETVFRRATLGESLDAVLAQGIRCFNSISAALEFRMSASNISEEACTQRQTLLSARGDDDVGGLRQFNMCHPDPRQRERGLESLRAIAAALSIAWDDGHHALQRHADTEKHVALSSGE